MTTAIAAVVFIAALMQGLSSFGFALIAMPFISQLLSVQVAVPLVAMMTLVNNVILLLCYRGGLQLAAIGKLVAGAVVGIPIGFVVLAQVPTTPMLKCLGVVVFAYAVYSFSRPAIPGLKSPGWAYLAGMLSGILLGSFNLPGPPAVIYGNSQRWPPDLFKSSLACFFSLSAAIAVTGHAAQGHFTASIVHIFLLAVPALVAGLFVGIALSNRLNANVFQKVISVLLAVAGINLVASS